MERAARITHDDTAQAKLDKLDVLLAQSFTPRPDAALLADMVSLPNDGRYQILELTPQQQRQKTLEAVIDSTLHRCVRSLPVRALQLFAVVIDFAKCRSETDSVKSGGGRRCSRLHTGSKHSACPSTPSVLPKTGLVSRHSVI